MYIINNNEFLKNVIYIYLYAQYINIQHFDIILFEKLFI